MSGPRHQRFDRLAPHKPGLSHWWLQRATAVILIPAMTWLIASLMYLSNAEYALVLEWFGKPVNTILLSVCVIALFWHLKLGLEVVIEDYIHHPSLLRWLNFTNIAFCWGCGISSQTSILIVAMS